MNRLDTLKVKIFADGANKKNMLEMYSKNFVKGLTTNPSLMKKEGIKDYKNFCIDILKLIKDKPISFEVFSDDFNEMERQALEIASWAENVYVKIPITNTKKETCYRTIKKLSKKKVKLNIDKAQSEKIMRIVNADNSQRILKMLPVEAKEFKEQIKNPDYFDRQCKALAIVKYFEDVAN